MDASIRDQSTWGGAVGMVLGRQLYVDMSGDLENPDYFAQAMGRLCEAITKKLCIAQERAKGAALGGLPAPPSHTHHTPALGVFSSPIASWLVSAVGITSERSAVYARRLEHHGVGNLKRLQKKASENTAFLASVGIDDADDASDIMLALSGELLREGMSVTDRFSVEMPMQGRKEYNDGTYEGDLLRGKRHGKGVFTWASGSRYEGDYKKKGRKSTRNL